MVSVAPSAVVIREGDASNDVIVRLSKTPAGVVRLDPVVTGDTAAVSSFYPLYLNSTTSTQFFVFGTYDSAITGSRQVSVAWTIADAPDASWIGIQSPPVAVTVLDWEGPAVLFRRLNSYRVNEGDSLDVMVELSTPPLDDVVVPVSLDPTAEATLSGPTSFTFLAGDTRPQGPGADKVTIDAVADHVVDGDREVFVRLGAASTADPGYAALPAVVQPIVVVDVDQPGVRFSPSVGSVVEGGAPLDVQVTLFTRPTASVTLVLTPDVTGQVTLVPSTFTIDPPDWNVPVTLQVTAVEDTLSPPGDVTALDGDVQVTFTAAITSSDAVYAALAPGPLRFTAITNERRLFVTAATFNANLGGPSGADAKCQADTRRPPNHVFRAMVGTGTTRVGSVTANTGDGQVNWVLNADSTYHRVDGTLVGTTGANRLWSFPLSTSPLAAASATIVWTGLHSDWTTGNTCSAWTSASTLGLAARGDVTATSTAVLQTGTTPCNASRALLCIE